jgi:L-lactate utilization protein LutB
MATAYHIVTPAMHLNKTDIDDIFDGTKTELVLTARHLLRNKCTPPPVGVTGDNFLIAELRGSRDKEQSNARLDHVPETCIMCGGGASRKLFRKRQFGPVLAAVPASTDRRV